MSEQFSGSVEVLDSASTNVKIKLDGDNADISTGGNGQDGNLVIKDSTGKQTIKIRGKTRDVLLGAGVSGDVSIHLDGNEGDIIVKRKIGGVHRKVMNFDASHAALYIGSKGNEGDIIVRDGNGKDVFRFDASYAVLDIGGKGNEGDIRVRDSSGDTRIHLDGNSGDIKLSGADCAEEFDVELEKIDPGTVLIIGDESKLLPCEEPYDKKVAGVVSGGNGSNPGIILDKNSTQQKRMPIALNGKVYCKVDAHYSPIEVGDLLTTSSVTGHAMKAEDPLKAFGAVIGKALRPLKEGKGLIPILVALQ